VRVEPPAARPEVPPNQDGGGGGKQCGHARQNGLEKLTMSVRFEKRKICLAHRARQ
jgi:hypothetical protein